MSLQQKGSYRNHIVLLKGYIVAEQKFITKIIKYFMFFCLLLIFCGCATNKKVYSEFPENQIGKRKIVFLGLRSAMPEGEGSDLFHNLLLNTMMRAEPVSQAVTDQLSDKLYTLIEEVRDYEMINMKQYQAFGQNNASPFDIKVIKEIVKEISADFVITGYVYRMHERQGGKYSAANPASAAFDIYIIDINKGTISWRGMYDKTQKPLSENLLDFKSFLIFKGKWTDVYSLAEAGLKELVDDLPFKNR
jgi:hypothetical protein